eukprot:10571760-Prorocentrum_lima.AAC.1
MPPLLRSLCRARASVSSLAWLGWGGGASVSAGGVGGCVPVCVWAPPFMSTPSQCVCVQPLLSLASVVGLSRWQCSIALWWLRVLLPPGWTRCCPAIGLGCPFVALVPTPGRA